MVGFYVVGVDHKAQPRYCGEEFVQADALEYLAEHGHEFDLIHASPPCQGVSVTRNLPWQQTKEFEVLLRPTRDALRGTGRAWVMENVYTARWGGRLLERWGLQEHGMQAGFLCGTMFGQPLYRHRLFEASFLWLQPTHEKHRLRWGGRSGKIGDWRNGRHESAATPQSPLLGSEWPGRRLAANMGHAAGVNLVREAMQIDWMTRDELTQAIPPVYSAWIGYQFMLQSGYDKRPWDYPMLYRELRPQSL